MADLITVVLEPTEHSMDVELYEGKTLRGHLRTRRSAGKFQSMNLWIVRSSEVDEDLRGQGHGSALYELAAREAIKRGGVLASTKRDPASKQVEALWARFVDEGEASVYPREHGPDVYVLDKPRGES